VIPSGHADGPWRPLLHDSERSLKSQARLSGRRDGLADVIAADNIDRAAELLVLRDRNLRNRASRVRMPQKAAVAKLFVNNAKRKLTCAAKAKCSNGRRRR